MSSYDDTWESVVKNPPEAYKELFHKERDFLRSQINPNASVLDIACGNGRNILSIVDITQNITGLDNSSQAVSDAKENLKDYPTVKIVLGDALNLPFEDGSFDVAVLSMTLVNFADGKLKALAEMKRVIKPEGKIILSVYSETALEERLSMYKQVGAEIQEEKDGFITFKIEGLTSEQFPKEQLDYLAEKSGLRIDECERIGNLAYVCTLLRS